MGAARWPNYEMGWGGGGVDRDVVKMDGSKGPALKPALSCMTPNERQIMRQVEISKS
ncbi:MAG: hypothetical protein IPK59_22335 [Rhodospirillaceae bacterium]|nr:hypothetical protein [Rhodospirillaceae bacterium]